MDIEGDDFFDWDRIIFDWVLRLEDWAHAAESKGMLEQVLELRMDVLDKLYALDGELARTHRNMIKDG